MVTLVRLVSTLIFLSLPKLILLPLKRFLTKRLKHDADTITCEQITDYFTVLAPSNENK